MLTVTDVHKFKYISVAVDYQYLSFAQVETLWPHSLTVPL